MAKDSFELRRLARGRLRGQGQGHRRAPQEVTEEVQGPAAEVPPCGPAPAVAPPSPALPPAPVPAQPVPAGPVSQRSTRVAEGPY